MQFLPQKMFQEVQTIVYHRNSHTIPRKCPKCKLYFNSSNCINYHLRTAHSENNSNPSRRLGIKNCEYCKKCMYCITHVKYTNHIRNYAYKTHSTTDMVKDCVF